MKHLYFIGIGGAGMAPLAEIAMERGALVRGSDRELNAKTAELAARGAVVYGEQRYENVPPDTELIVYSSAVAPDHPERRAGRDHGIPELRRGEFLGEITPAYEKLVAISGAHGKTSITALVVFILTRCGRHPGYLIGGMLPGFPPGAAGGDSEFFITEADESDGTHTRLRPWLGIVPNADDDHAWSVGGEARLRANFRTFAHQSTRLLYFADTVPGDWFADHPNAEAYTAADLGSEFNAFTGFQKRNAFLAVRAAELCGVPREAALAAARQFPGVARRMTLHRQSEQRVVIEDYAHHPKELAASLQFLRERYPEHHLRVIFQPHRYARLAKYLDELAAILATADSVWIPPVFAAWSESGEVDHHTLAARIGAKATAFDGSWEELAQRASDYGEDRPLLLAVIGAGDVEKVLASL